MMSGIKNEVKEKIIAEFTRDLRQHLFSDRSYPQEVTIRTIYEGCAQTLTIHFGENKQREQGVKKEKFVERHLSPMLCDKVKLHE